MQLQQETEIETLIRAGYPVIYIVSSEETRVQRSIEEIALRLKKKVFDWSCTTGLASFTSTHVVKSRASTTRDPITALDQVMIHAEPSIFVFKDFHPFLSRGNYAVIRKLKEISMHLKHSEKTVVLIAPSLEVPTELEKEVTVLSFPLPDHDELAILLDKILADVAIVRRVQVELDADGRERLLQAALGLTLGEAENVFSKIIVRDARLTSGVVNEVFAEKRQIIKKSGLLDYYSAEETFSDIGGLSVLKDWLQKRTVAFTPRAREFGLPSPKGILMLGVQGCGKSLCAKAVSSLWQLPLLRFDIGRMFGSLVGSSEENVRRAIAVAESVAPAILWVDEIDKAFAGSRGGGSSDGGTSARVFGTFLTWLSEKTVPIFVVATANDISSLPAELMRKGRLDEIFFVDLPSEAEREDIFRIHLMHRHRDPANFDLKALAANSPEFSGAEIKEAIISALYEAFDAGIELATDHVLHALRETVPLAKTMDEQIRALRTWADGRARNASVTRAMKL